MVPNSYEPKKIKIPFKWEIVPCEENNIFRAKVFGGWIVELLDESPLFIPDPNHQWEVK